MNNPDLIVVHQIVERRRRYEGPQSPTGAFIGGVTGATIGLVGGAMCRQIVVAGIASSVGFLSGLIFGSEMGGCGRQIHEKLEFFGGCFGGVVGGAFGILSSLIFTELIVQDPKEGIRFAQEYIKLLSDIRRI